MQAIEFLLKIADPDRGSHSTKYDQAEKNKKSQILGPFKVRGNPSNIKEKCISPQTALKTIYTQIFIFNKLNTIGTKILVNHTKLDPSSSFEVTWLIL